MPNHEHLIAQYTADALMIDEPWTLWESRLNKPGKEWRPFTERAPEWRETHEYRRTQPFPHLGGAQANDGCGQAVYLALDKLWVEASRKQGTSRPEFAAAYPLPNGCTRCFWVSQGAGSKGATGADPAPLGDGQVHLLQVSGDANVLVGCGGSSGQATPTKLIHPPRVGSMCTLDGAQHQWFGTSKDLQALKEGRVCQA